MLHIYMFYIYLRIRLTFLILSKINPPTYIHIYIYRCVYIPIYSLTYMHIPIYICIYMNDE